MLTVMMTASAACAEEAIDVVDALALPKAQGLGQDAVRFSAQPQLGGTATVVSFVKTDNGVRADVHWAEGHPYTGWEQTGSWTFHVEQDRYLRLASLVDEGIASSGPPMEQMNPDGSETIVVCSDGPGYRTERVAGGVVTQLEGGCGKDHPNIAIARAVFGVVKDQMSDPVE